MHVKASVGFHLKEYGNMHQGQTAQTVSIGTAPISIATLIEAFAVEAATFSVDSGLHTIEQANAQMREAAQKLIQCADNVDQNLKEQANVKSP